MVTRNFNLPAKEHAEAGNLKLETALNSPVFSASPLRSGKERGRSFDI